MDRDVNPGKELNLFAMGANHVVRSNSEAVEILLKRDYPKIAR